MCFVAAIKNSGRSGGAGIVPGSVWMFCPQSTKDHFGDYHKVFTSDNYVKWFKSQLLPNLQDPSLIIIDNVLTNAARCW